MTDEIKTVLELRVYDVMNILGNIMMNNESSEESIELCGLINGFNNDICTLKITLSKEDVEDE